jgi:Na+-driven multidrug efflux pump
MVDTFMVSHLGDDAVAGLAVANQIVMLLHHAVLLRRHRGRRRADAPPGAGDREGAEKVAATAIGVNFWLGALVSVLVWASAQLLRMLQLPPALMPYAQPFLALMGATLFLEALNIAFGAVLRAHGHTREVMVIAVGMNVLNLCLNYVLIFGMFGAPENGRGGRRLSTVISRFMACIALGWLVRRQLKLRLRICDPGACRAPRSGASWRSAYRPRAKTCAGSASWSSPILSARWARPRWPPSPMRCSCR